MERRVQTSTAFAPALVASRMRRGLWVDGRCIERSVSDMTIQHVRGTLTWLLDNASYYGSLLILHPDRGVQPRGNYVEANAHVLGNPQRLREVVKETKLVKDLERAIRSYTAPRRQPTVRTEGPSAAEVRAAMNPRVVSAVLQQFEPAPGQISTLELDDGTTISITSESVTVTGPSGTGVTTTR